MKEHPIFSFLEDYLKNPDQEILIGPVKNGLIPITVTRKFPVDTPFHDIIGSRPDVDFSLKKRAGKKVAQELSIKHSIPLALKSTSGNPSATPINRKTDTTLSDSD